MRSNDLKNLKESDAYTLILFALYKLTNEPGYSVISELVYTLDKDSLLNLCSTLGGCTIKIPTIDELKVVTTTFVLWSKINEEHMSFNEAFKSLNLDKKLKQKIVNMYNIITKVISEYVATND